MTEPKEVQGKEGKRNDANNNDAVAGENPPKVNHIEVEIVLKEPLKLMVASPVYQLEILRIWSKEAEIDLDNFENKKIAKITPHRVFTTQHTDWIDFERSSVVIPEIYVPTNNIAGIIKK
ncbi:MAG: hypothetical protein EPN22_16445 [Nitrospirae bacterium]|nr:MAG: hypothetical protein EPN22_16445 [Nitrospirota bacterium]